MSDLAMLRLISITTDVLMLVTLASFWWVLWQARRSGPSPVALAVPFLLAFVWGAAWTWYPALAAARLAPPPGGQVIAIAAVAAASIGLLLLPRVRQYFRTADLAKLTWLGPWRIVYGAGLLLMGTSGGLPAAFFWSAGIGDIFIGLWSLWLLPRRATVTTTELTLWNLFGLADLLHVLAIGAVTLRPFYLGNPDIPTLNLLPLVGVPLFIALHVLSLWALAQRRTNAVAA
jgi:hypothetical protein